MRLLTLTLVLVAVSACATPEVAEDYQAQVYVPDELTATFAELEQLILENR